MPERDPVFRWIGEHPVWTGLIAFVVFVGFVSQLIAFAVVGTGALQPTSTPSTSVTTP